VINHLLLRGFKKKNGPIYTKVKRRIKAIKENGILGIIITQKYTVVYKELALDQIIYQIQGSAFCWPSFKSDSYCVS
jgi:hypothetical protein